MKRSSRTVRNTDIVSSRGMSSSPVFRTYYITSSVDSCVRQTWGESDDRMHVFVTLATIRIELGGRVWLGSRVRSFFKGLCVGYVAGMCFYRAWNACHDESVVRNWCFQFCKTDFRNHFKIDNRRTYDAYLERQRWTLDSAQDQIVFTSLSGQARDCSRCGGPLQCMLFRPWLCRYRQSAYIYPRRGAIGGWWGREGLLSCWGVKYWWYSLSQPT